MNNTHPYRIPAQRIEDDTRTFHRKLDYSPYIAFISIYVIAILLDLWGMWYCLNHDSIGCFFLIGFCFSIKMVILYQIIGTLIFVYKRN